MSTKPTVAPLLLPLVVVLASIALGVASVWAQPPSAAAEASNRDTAIDLEADVDADATDKPPAEDGEQDEPQAVEQQKQEKKDPSSTQQTQFAPGIVTVIPPAPHPKETSDGPHTLPQLLEMHPEIKLGGDTHPGGEPHFDPRARTLLEMAKQVFLYREIYCLEFSFKPLRHFYVDVPRPNGRLQRKLIWYMVYRARYRGQDLRPATKKVGDGDVHERMEAVHYDARYFFPMLKLVEHTSGKEYIDRILPAVIPKIKIREKITTKLHNSVEMGTVKIPYTSDPDAPGVWGVATWEDVDPNADFVSVEVFGLTNAFEQDGVEPDSPYRRKALKLYFYRPGDTIDQTDDRIRFGIPAFEDEEEQEYVLKQYGLDERLDYRWIFR